MFMTLYHVLVVALILSKLIRSATDVVAAGA